MQTSSLHAHEALHTVHMDMTEGGCCMSLRQALLDMHAYMTDWLHDDQMRGRTCAAGWRAKGIKKTTDFFSAAFCSAVVCGAGEDIIDILVACGMDLLAKCRVTALAGAANVTASAAKVEATPDADADAEAAAEAAAEAGPVSPRAVDPPSASELRTPDKKKKKKKKAGGAEGAAASGDAALMVDTPLHAAVRVRAGQAVLRALLRRATPRLDKVRGGVGSGAGRHGTCTCHGVQSKHACLLGTWHLLLAPFAWIQGAAACSAEGRALQGRRA